MKKPIVHKFSKNDKFKRFEVPFEVPDNIDIMELEVNIINKTDEKTIIDIGVRDAENIRGWTGSGRNYIKITAEYATPGYFPGKIKKGIWAFLLSAYKVPEIGCEVMLTVKLSEKKYRWLKGDTHFHTVHSDGDSCLIDIIKTCKELNFDYLVSTNHNTMTQNCILPTDEEIILIPGMELTTYHGHANIVGLKQPVKDYRCNTKDDVQKIFTEAKSKGAYIGLNHPFWDDNEGCDWGWGFDFPFDWIEVWNKAWNHMNQKAVDLWHKYLCEGKKIPAVGGSDMHKLAEYKTYPFPVVNAYVDSIDGKAILENFKKGHVFINRINGPVVDDVKTENNDTFGDITKNNLIYIGFSNLKKSDEICVITNKGIEHKHDVQKDGKFEFEFKRNNQLFVRIEVRRYNYYWQKIETALISNPVYFE